VPAIYDNEAVVARAVRLAKAARLLDVPVIATEQNPAGLGPTVACARQHGAEIVTSEMVLFEWLRDSRHPKFRKEQKLLK
jgi:hypothetical protein